MRDNIWQRRYFLIWAVAVISMIMVFVEALSDRYSIKDEYWRRGNCPRSMLSVLSAIVSLLWVFSYSNCMNHDDYKWQRSYYLRPKIAVFTVVVVGSLTCRCWWFFMINDHLSEWNYLPFTAAVAVDGLGFSTVWRWHYDGHDYWQQRLDSPASVITKFLAIGSYLSAFWCCYYMNFDDKWLGFLQSFVLLYLLSPGPFLFFRVGLIWLKKTRGLGTEMDPQ